MSNNQTTSTPPNYTEISKALLKKALPITASVLLITTGTFVRQKLLSDLSHADFAGADLAAGVQNFLFSPITTLIKQNAVFAALLMGELKHVYNDPSAQASHYEEMGKVLRQGWILSVFSGLVISILVPLSGPTFSACGISDAIVNSSQDYLLPTMISIPARIAILANQRFLVAVNQEKWLIPFTIFAVVQGIFLDWLFILSFNNIKGAAWSTVTQSYVNLLLNMLLFACHSSFTKFSIFKSDDIRNTQYIRKTIAQGWPLSLRDMALAARVLVFRVVMGAKFSKFALIIDQVAKFFYTTIEEAFALALNESGNRLTAQALGLALQEKTKENFQVVGRYGNTSAVYSIYSYTVLALIVTILYKPFAAIFIKDNDLSEHSSLIQSIFMAMCVEYFCNVLRRSFASNLSACEDTFLASFISVATTAVVTIPTAFIALYLFDAGQSGLYLSIALGFAVDALILFKKWYATNNNMVEDLDYDPHQTSTNATIAKVVSDLRLHVSQCCAGLFSRASRTDPRARDDEALNRLVADPGISSVGPNHQGVRK